MQNDILKAILDWNPWLEGMFPKELSGLQREHDLLKYLDIPEVKILEGARRVGKSTLIYRIIHHLVSNSKNVLYVNFDDEILKNYSLNDIFFAYSEHKKVDYLFVDEIQQCKEWVHFIRKLYDRKTLKQIWISGSNSSLIKNEYSSLLTGRNITLHIYPLNFKEFCNFNNITFQQSFFSQEKMLEIKRAFNKYLKFGALPAIALRNVYQKELLINYFDDFIYKDIASRYQVNTNKIKELGIYLASNTTNIISYRKIAQALGMHASTITEYINYFKEIYLFDEIYKFDYSLKKQLSNDKKIYGLDVGLIGAVSFSFSDNLGHKLENLVYLELKRYYDNIYFHKLNKECDFILKEELDITKAIQVTSSLKDNIVKEREYAGLLEAMQTYKLNQGLILTFNENFEDEISTNDKTYKIIVKPIWQWLLEKEK